MNKSGRVVMHQSCTQIVAAYRGTREEQQFTERSFYCNTQLVDLAAAFRLFKKPSNRRKTPAMGLGAVIRKLLHYFVHSFCG
jgi:hypothetical protein